mmetsp:Transcript_67895/g.164121  ORF Transcript_67895/g.164121 Transcript_67895/m.164121 type:complete len:443 (-) Transcript_67895:358-1686(-)
MCSCTTMHSIQRKWIRSNSLARFLSQRPLSASRCHHRTRAGCSLRCFSVQGGGEAHLAPTASSHQPLVHNSSCAAEGSCCGLPLARRLRRAPPARPAVHHVLEFVEIENAVSSDVVITQNLQYPLASSLHVVRARVEHLFQFLLGDGAVAVAVEDLEGREQRVVGEVAAAVQSSGQELRVVDQPVAIRVGHGHHAAQVQAVEAGAREAAAELLLGQRSIPVRIQRLEGRTQVLHLFLTEVPRDDFQHRALQLVPDAEALEPFHQVLVKGCLPRRWRLPRDPDVLESLLRRQALHGIHLQQLADQVLRITADAPPVVALKAESALLDLLENVLVAAPWEGRAAAEQGVEGDASAPEVALLVVPPLEHLRRHVEGRAGAGAEHGAGLAGTGKAKIDELHGVLLKLVLRQEQEVLRLQVTVCDVLIVDVADRPEDLLHDNGRLVL